MAKTSIPYDERATCERGVSYVYHAQDIYWKKYPRKFSKWRPTYYREPVKDLPFLHKLYAEGVRDAFIAFPYPKFEEWVLKESSVYCDCNTPSAKKNPSKKLPWWYWRKHPKPALSLLKCLCIRQSALGLGAFFLCFTFLTYFVVKNHGGHYTCGRTEHRKANRSHRMWVKRQIKNENWDSLWDSERKQWYYDWW